MGRLVGLVLVGWLIDLVVGKLKHWMINLLNDWLIKNEITLSDL